MQSKAAVYTISTAKTLSSTNEILHIGLSKLAWSNSVIGGGFFLLIGLYLISQGGNSMLFGAFALSLAAIMAYTYPLQADLIFDFHLYRVQFSVRYLLHFPMKAEGQWNFSQVVKADRQRAGLGQHRISVLMADGNRFALDFGKKKEADGFLQRVENLNSAAALDEPQAARAVEQAQVSESQALMQRELRTWSVWLLIIGVFQMLAAQGFSPWGTLLILVGLASLYIREAPMFIVFAGTVAWAGINNLLSGQIVWYAFAAFQAFIVFQLVRQFRRFNKMHKSQAGGGTPGRASRLFPWLSLVLGGGGLAGIILLFLSIFLVALLTQNSPPLQALRYAETAMVYAGVLGIATGSASLASGYPHKTVSIIGCVAGALVVVFELAFVLFL